MIPSRRLVLLLAGPALLALFVVVDPALLLPVLILDAAIALLALLDAASVREPLVLVSREAPDVLSVGRPNLIRLVLRSRTRRKLRVRVNDDLFDAASAEGLPAETELAAFAEATLEYRLTPARRGAYELGPSSVRYPSLLGLWSRQHRGRELHAVRVYPDLLQLRAYELTVRENRDNELTRATRRRGGETEFARLRDYTRDDEYRSLDWKATARRQKLTAREYQLESNQELVLMLDAGRMMSAEVQGLTQFDHALNAALMLAHIAVRTGDRVGLLAFDAQLRAFIAPVRGRAGASRLIRASYDLHPELLESDYDAAFKTLATRQRKRALVVIFTQVLDDAVARSVLRGCRLLARQHLPLVVPFRDLDIEALAQPKLQDQGSVYVQAAAGELLRWRSGFIRDLRHGGALVLDVAPRELTTRLINHYFEVKARHWL